MCDPLLVLAVCCVIPAASCDSPYSRKTPKGRWCRLAPSACTDKSIHICTKHTHTCHPANSTGLLYPYHSHNRTIQSTTNPILLVIFYSHNTCIILSRRLSKHYCHSLAHQRTGNISYAITANPTKQQQRQQQHTDINKWYMM